MRLEDVLGGAEKKLAVGGQVHWLVPGWILAQNPDGAGTDMGRHLPFGVAP